ncbi:MAG: sugar phosphate isomerase/epimerase family protein [Sedimentisphaerales bacterium]|nr:sugar phosphate isomerase/epimerase family protein [Sedimentisphaerales bacterium]HNY77654.1 sugar phosphate isomerase/epimerase family protein [Sedimentisphaerales bacterium]HOC61987.1 sugar phosphate isomerase/epimerase family protein [Sedimentisphaerales bacterium]HOH63829.1 sugar phosphate isomerase/epimerase family protein [Sedimentisphaerales bacterium]HPY50096.1 sugar phosphate isomerase/epimerase family protein [Sedimentisphaerales bacterium]
MANRHRSLSSNPSPMSRREMMSMSLGTALALGTTALTPHRAAAGANNYSPVLQGGKPTRKPIFKSLKFGMIQGDMSILDKFKLVQDLGYDGVELDSPGGQDKQQCLEASRKTGLPIHGVVDSRHWSVRATEADPKRRQECLNDLLTAIKESNYCGGSTVLFVPGHGNDGPESEIVPRCLDVIGQALPTAAKLGVRILIENVWNRMFYDHDGAPEQGAERYAAFIDACKSPWVGAYYDIGNHHKYGRPQEWIRTLGTRIVKLDVKGYSREKNNWCEIGDGTIDWPAVREALDEVGFTGWCTAEVGGGGRERLADILARLNRVLPN